MLGVRGAMNCATTNPLCVTHKVRLGNPPTEAYLEVIFLTCTMCKVAVLYGFANSKIYFFIFLHPFTPETVS